MKRSEILIANHYEIQQVRGDCTGWFKDFENGKTVLISVNGSHEIDELRESQKMKINIWCQFETEQGDYIRIESQENNIQLLVNFINFLDDLDDTDFRNLADFNPLVTI